MRGQNQLSEGPLEPVGSSARPCLALPDSARGPARTAGGAREGEAGAGSRPSGGVLGVLTREVPAHAQSQAVLDP